jgi:hypothetical protein
MIWGYLLFHPRLLIDVWRALEESLPHALAKRRRSPLTGSEKGLLAGRSLSEEWARQPPPAPLRT